MNLCPSLVPKKSKVTKIIHCLHPHFMFFSRSVAHFDKAVFVGGSPKLGESQGLEESLRLSPIIGESLKLSPKLGESFRGELFDMKELCSDTFLLVFETLTIQMNTTTTCHFESWFLPDKCCQMVPL